MVTAGSVVGCRLADDRQVEFVTEDIRRFRKDNGQVCHQHRIRLEEVYPLDDDLESVFRYLVGGPAKGVA